MSAERICVIIAAYSAEETVGRAVASALAQPEVAEVIVVDDASPDNTSGAARAVDDGSNRLKIVRSMTNGGPSAARNLAISISSSPLIAVLDADDFFLDGRFARLLSTKGYELAADNIVFIPSTSLGSTLSTLDDARTGHGFVQLDMATFVAGNLANGSIQRGELGFLKPVMSRAFLEKHGLGYDTGMWLGEDYDLYMRMLLAGAKFGLTRSVGYGAIVRPSSLSGKHRTNDLLELAKASERHLGALKQSDKAWKYVVRHASQTRNKYLLRAFLDVKSNKGLLQAAHFALSPISNLWPILRGVLRDKSAALFPSRAAPVEPQQRLLITPDSRL